MLIMNSVLHCHVIKLNRVKFQRLQLCRLNVPLHDMNSWMTLLITMPQGQVVDNVPDIVTLVVTW